MYASPREPVIAGPPEQVEALIAVVAARDRLTRSPMYRTFRTSTKVSWSAPAVAMAWLNRTGLSRLAAQ